ncbi:hypothetical protein P4561_07315, partial [Priestia flexa]|uniref:hypothetical protein n=1 Tax=Priestia flexa TaxID=86664 RepID=UPI002E1BA478|nr:hypothetical protein [Priestia flexa]
ANNLGMTPAVILEFVNDISFLEEKKVVTFDIDEAIEELQLSYETMKEAFRELVSFGYLETKKRGNNQIVKLKKKVKTADQYFYVKPGDKRFNPKMFLARTILEDQGDWATNKFMYETSGIFNKDTGNVMLNNLLRKGIIERKRDRERIGVGRGNGNQIRYRYKGDQ